MQLGVAKFRSFRKMLEFENDMEVVGEAQDGRQAFPRPYCAAKADAQSKP